MKTVKHFFFLIAAAIVMLTPMMTTHAASNPYYKSSNKTYTYRILDYYDQTHLRNGRIKNGAFTGYQDIEFHEFHTSKKRLTIDFGGAFLQVAIPANVNKTKKVYIYEGATNKGKSLKVKTKQKVKTSYKTFKNAMVIKRSGFTISVAPGYGVVKMTYAGKTYVNLVKVRK